MSTHTLTARATELVTRRVPFVDETVVRAEHPTSAHPGDAAIVLEVFLAPRQPPPVAVAVGETPVVAALGELLPVVGFEVATTRGKATAVDPVCGMAVTVTPETVHLSVDGDDHWFCIQGCAEQFTAQQSS